MMNYIPFTNKKYKTIYADPPWQESGGGKIKRGADRHYPLMTTKEICELPVQQIADENCHLYLWTTNNFLQDAFKVMEAWGFEYITCITWMKDRQGLGQYYRGLTEHCLFGRKGMVPYKTIDGKRQQGVTIVRAVTKRVQEYAGKYGGLQAGNFQEIIHLIDTDGSFIPDNHIINDSEL